MEYFDVYDAKGNNTKAVCARGNHLDILKDIEGYQPATTALIIVNDQILLDKRAACKDFAGYWEVPGGGMLVSETPLQGIIRELKEEIGLSISEVQCQLIDTTIHEERRIYFFNYVICLDSLDLNQLKLQENEVGQVCLINISKLNDFIHGNEKTLDLQFIFKLLDKLNIRY